MSQSYVAVLFFHAGQCSADTVLQGLAPMLQPGGESADGGISTALGGRWGWVQDPQAGFCAAVWRLPANNVHRDETTGVALVEACLARALATLAPVFAYFSIFEEHAGETWLRRVFAQLATGDWEALLAPAYERLLLPPHLAGRYLDHPQWVVLADEPAGVLVRTGRF
jgi:hypothetical protein